MANQGMKDRLGSIKSRLGFGHKQKAEYEEYYGDEYERYEDDFDDYEDDYEDYGFREDDSSSYGSVRPARYDSGRSMHTPRLVSLDDVRANTRIPDSLNRDPLPPRHVTSPSSTRTSGLASRTMVDSSLPPQMTPEGTAAQAAAGSRRYSEGYESLFSPTTGSSSSTIDQPVTSRPASDASSGFDPYTAYSTGTGEVVYSSTRSLVVIAPTVYGDAERVAKSLKAGDAVILSLKGTAESLSKRILDFSFGAAAALDANVECIGDKVFAVTRGTDLSDRERSSLRGQGVIQ